MKKFTYVELYSGIGGFRQALDSFGGECVFASEIDDWCIKTYYKNYNQNSHFDMDLLKNAGNKELKKRLGSIKTVDLICGGFPCQTFSNAGKKKGFNDKRNIGNQFFNILKVLDYLKPKFLFLENVKHLATHDNGKTFKRIQEELTKRKYFMPEKKVILSPHQLGIRQRRERFFIIAYKNEIPRNFNLNLNNVKFKDVLILDKKENKKYIVDKEISSKIEIWGKLLKKIKFPKNRTLPVLWIDEMIDHSEIPLTLPRWKIKYLNDMRSVYSENKKLIDKWIKKYNVKSWKKRDKKFEFQAGKHERDIKNTVITLRQSGIRCKSKKIFPTLVAMVQIPMIYDNHLNKWRYLTPRETAKLQSFPSDFKICDNDFQAYKQFGNAVNVDVIKYLFKYYFEDKIINGKNSKSKMKKRF